MIESRFQRNLGTFTEEEFDKIKESKVFIAGCGGSEYIIDFLVRAGINTIAVADGDSFEESNMNRQLFANINNIGRKKVEVAKEYAELINPDLKFIAYPEFITEENIKEFIYEYDVVLDCVDNVESKLIIQNACVDLKKPLVFGGMARWMGQVGISLPDDRGVERIYCLAKKRKRKKEILDKSVSSTTAFINAFTSALYVTLCLKILTNQKYQSNKMYIYNLRTMKTAHINLKRCLIPFFRRW